MMRRIRPLALAHERQWNLGLDGRRDGFQYRLRNRLVMATNLRVSDAAARQKAGQAIWWTKREGAPWHVPFSRWPVALAEGGLLRRPGLHPEPKIPFGRHRKNPDIPF